MAPTIAVSKMLDRAGLQLQDFDFYEIHEAFAAQVLATLKAWEDPEYCKEVLGKDRAAGLHRPLEDQRAGARPSPSGIRSRRPARASSATSPSCCRSIGGRGLISICTAGGMGVAAILESKDAAELHQAA